MFRILRPALAGTAFRGKIFGIGLSGTGTRSLIEALKALGFHCRHYPKKLEHFRQYQAFADISVSCRYKELDVMFPGAKFILTTRDLEGWLSNRAKKAPDTDEKSLWVQETRLRTYGVPSYDREKYIVRFEEFHRGAAEHFASRPGDLLTMSIIGGAGWETLCPFLGIDTLPESPFPSISSYR